MLLKIDVLLDVFSSTVVKEIKNIYITNIDTPLLLKILFLYV